MIFFGSNVISAGGIDGGIKIAEIDALVVVPYSSAKPAFVLSKPYAFVARTILPHSRIPGVLSNCSKTKIGPSIVQAVAIDVVDNEIRRSSPVARIP